MQVFSVVLTTFLVSLTNSCVTPTGLGNGVGEVDYTQLVFPPTIFGEFLNAYFPFLLVPETPVQARIIQTSAFAIWNSMAAYEQNTLDYFGRVVESNNRRICPHINSQTKNKYRQVTLAYVLHFIGVQFTGISDDTIISMGLDPNICEDNNFNCNDVSTPWGFANIIVNEVINYAKNDGWNADGSYNRDYNKIPYQDFRDDPYEPVNSPYKLTQKKRWQPLLESNEEGFLFNQQHVTPHIGFTGRSVFLSNDYFCSLEVPKPYYDYNAEMIKTIDRLASLTEQQKLEIEFFDSKLTSLVPLLVQYYARQGLSLDSWEFMLADLGTITALYEAVLVVWRSKVLYDSIRPPSIIQHDLDDVEITSYAGTTSDGESLGTQTFLGRNWEPYIRTMPHAEFPSGSACICKAFTDTMILLTGDDVTSVIGGPLVHEIPAFSSFREPLSTPQQDSVLFFNTWSEINTRCGQSRLDGGMHFTASVPLGNQLCSGIGDKIYNAITNLNNGIVPEYTLDINDATIVQDRCDTL